MPFGQSRRQSSSRADHLARPFEQREQDPERLLLQRDPQAALAQLSRADVHLEGAEPQISARAGIVSIRHN